VCAWLSQVLDQFPGQFLVLRAAFDTFA
jgi:hypothetical protein